MKKTISIEGMSCSHCVRAVETALKALPGVIGVEVSLERKQAVVEAEPGAVSDAMLQAAVEDQGYEVKAIG